MRQTTSLNPDHFSGGQVKAIPETNRQYGKKGPPKQHEPNRKINSGFVCGSLPQEEEIIRNIPPIIAMLLKNAPRFPLRAAGSLIVQKFWNKAVATMLKIRRSHPPIPA
jgi:hypothetical protein